MTLTLTLTLTFSPTRGDRCIRPVPHETRLLYLGKTVPVSCCPSPPRLASIDTTAMSKGVQLDSGNPSQSISMLGCSTAYSVMVIGGRYQLSSSAVDHPWCAMCLSMLQCMGFQRAGGGGRDKIGPGSAAGRHVRQRHPYRVLPKVGGKGVCTLYGGRDTFPCIARNKFLPETGLIKKLSICRSPIQSMNIWWFLSNNVTVHDFSTCRVVAFFVGSLSLGSFTSFTSFSFLHFLHFLHFFHLCHFLHFCHFLHLFHFFAFLAFLCISFIYLHFLHFLSWFIFLPELFLE